MVGMNESVAGQGSAGSLCRQVAGVRERLIFWLKVSRPGLWSTTAWFYMLPLGQRPVFNHWTFWLGLGYVMFPLGFLLYGWNDIGDRETDQFNQRKDTFLFGARGTPAQLARLPLDIVLVQLPFLILFTALLGWRGPLWFVAMTTANGLYNNRRFPFKSHPPLDVLNQAGYLLVFVLSSWINGVPQLPAATFLFGALFAMHSHLFAEVMDIEPDRRAGRCTSALLLGVRASKAVLIAMLLFETIFVFHVFHNWIIGGVLALSVAWFTLDATVIFGDRLYPQWLIRLFAFGLNAAAMGSLWWVWSSGALTQVGR